MLNYQCKSKLQLFWNIGRWLVAVELYYDWFITLWQNTIPHFNYANFIFDFGLQLNDIFNLESVKI